MRSMLAAKSAEFLDFKLFLMQLLILGGGVIPVFTNRAFKIDYFAHSALFFTVTVKSKLETGIEPVTPSLPRTCSTN